MGLEGQVLGDYRILREIGRGGMGVVYLAEQVSLGRRVALKVLPVGRALTPDLLTRFRREAEAASRLDHPGICAIHASGEQGGVPFIAMRYVEGATLAQITRDRRRERSTTPGPPSEDTFRFVFEGHTEAGGAGDTELGEGAQGVETEPSSVTTSQEDLLWAVRMIEKAARAVHHAHEARVIHRDIKPSNIMVTPEGQPVLLDFGLARSLENLESHHSLTQSGDVVGTPHYMSPEQIGGHGRVDARTDVYSLGVTLYELLGGRRPYEEPNRERLYRAILQADAPPLSKLNPRVEIDLELVVSTALERDLDRRYQTAEAFANDLRAVLEHEPIAARPIGRWLRMRKWTRRNPTVATVGGASILFLTILLVDQYLHSQRLESLREKESSARQVAEAEKARANAAAERNASLVAERDQTLRDTRALRFAAEASSRAVREPALALALAREAAKSLRSAETDRALREAIAGSPETALFPAPLFPSLVDDRTPDPANRIRPNTQQRLRTHTPITGDIHWDAGLLVTLAPEPTGAPVIWNLRDGTVQAVLAGHAGQIFTARFSPDGERVVTAGSDVTARVFDSRTGDMLGETPLRTPSRFLQPNAVEFADFAPSGRMVYAAAENLVCTWQETREGYALPRDADVPYRSVGCAPVLAHHPSLPILASAATERVHIWSPFSGLRRFVAVPGEPSPVTAIAWRPAGTGRDRGMRLAVGTASGAVAVFEVPRSGQPTLEGKWSGPVRAHTGPVRVVAFSPDGEWIASGSDDQTVSVLHSADGVPRYRELFHNGGVRSLTWSRDGSRLATGCTDATARIFNAQRGTIERTLAGHTDWVVGVSISPDGRQLLTQSYDGSARLFDLSATQDSLNVSLPGEVSSISWCNDGEHLIVTSRDGAIASVPCDQGGAIANSIISPGGEPIIGCRPVRGPNAAFLTISGGEHWLSCWPLQGEPLWRIPRPPGAGLGTGHVRGRCVSDPAGATVLAVGPKGVPTLVRMTDGEILRSWPELGDPLRLLLAQDQRGRCLLWPSLGAPHLLEPDLLTLHALEWRKDSGPRTGLPEEAIFDRAGSRVALLDTFGSLQVVDIERVEAPRLVFESVGPIAGVPAFSPTHPTFVVPFERHTELRSTADGTLLRTLSVGGPRVHFSQFSSDGQRLILVVPGELRMWDTEADRSLAEIPLGSAQIDSVEPAPDGDRVAIGFANGALRVIRLDAEAAAEAIRVRPPSVSEMERFGLGTREDRAREAQIEEDRYRRIEIDCLRQRFRYQRTPQHAMAYVRRVLDPKDAILEELPQALALLEQLQAALDNPQVRDLLARGRELEKMSAPVAK